ncbi:hypothetical protein [Chryseobacterium nepalense]|uniref:Uncharacterized protein n=1 Tax=Chryseobacterium nepalense TaxID=1854498 RepID=A0ABY4K4S8_9FLAO|nr:hypothetical protein [Chryseobacterium nepalense]UPQ75798.1 hypothetical protein M0D58_17340 [Chryseobacterium nepalense]
MKRIYYVPGVISALLIPVLFWFYGSQKYREIHVNMIDFKFPAKFQDEKATTVDGFEPYRKLHYKKIIVKPNTARENSVFYISEIKKLQKRNEKDTGIEFILNDKNTYDDLVSLRNDMAISKQSSYYLDLDKTGHFFVILKLDGASLFTNDDIVDRCGNEIIDFSSDYFKKYYLKGFQKFEYQLTKLPENSYYVIFSFLLFLNISMFSIKENLQLKKKIA